MLTVIARVPEENLLAFNVRQGWEFLCKFLGKADPQKNFPRVFGTEQYLDTVQKKRKVSRRKAVQQGWFLRQWLLQLLELAGDVD
jgi:hypothetical protein